MNSNFSFYGIDLPKMPLILVIISLIISIFLAPLFIFWVGYFFGWISKLIIGKWIVAGFALFGITLPIDKIPLLAGLIAWIFGFKINTNINKRKD